MNWRMISKRPRVDDAFSALRCRLHPTEKPPLLNGRPFVLVFIAFLVNNVEKWEKVWRIGRKCLLLHDYLDVRIDEMND